MQAVFTEVAIQYFEAHAEERIAKLSQLTRFPTVSAEYAQRKASFEACAQWIKEEIQRMGWETVELIRFADGPPAIYAEWLGAGKNAPTLLLYGHYDVVPAETPEQWLHPPFEPHIEEERLYARGASDDKGQIWAILCAVEACLKGYGSSPLNLKALIEGEEESMSVHLAAFLEANQQRLKCDGILIADMDALHPQVPLIMYGTRGNCTVEVALSGPTHDLHSGTYGGGVENPLNVLVRLLASIQDGETRRILVPGFYDAVRPLSEREQALLEEIPINDEMGLAITGAPALAGESGYPLKARISSRPTFEVHGICGGYCGSGIKTVIPARATAKLSFRLVPDQDPQVIGKLVSEYLLKQAPPTVRMEVHFWGKANPATVDLDAPLIQAGEKALQRAFGAPPRFVRGGGSIPILNILQERLHPHILLTGYGLPQDNTHGVNESISLSQFRKGVHSVIYLLEELAGKERGLNGANRDSAEN